MVLDLEQLLEGVYNLVIYDFNKKGMKNKILLLVIFQIAICINPSISQNFDKYYKKQLEPNSKCINSGKNYTIEKTKDNSYIYKVYYPETKQVTEILTSKDEDFKVVDGLYQKNYDDGTIVKQGYFSNGIKTGQWVENISNHGKYLNNLREGEWIKMDKDSRVKSRSQYLNGKLNGSKIYYDSLSQIKFVEEYTDGELISSTRVYPSDRNKFPEEFPRFLGCENPNLDSEEIKKCSQKKLSEYVYSNIKYPDEARKHKIEGNALVRFWVNKEGQVQDIKVLNGICSEIESICVDLIRNMPKWRPGYQRGGPVKVAFTLPINFKLKPK